VVVLELLLAAGLPLGLAALLTAELSEPAVLRWPALDRSLELPEVEPVSARLMGPVELFVLLPLPEGALFDDALLDAVETRAAHRRRGIGRQLAALKTSTPLTLSTRCTRMNT
jgi:GNAT superfamily N-acetyltransferase